MKKSAYKVALGGVVSALALALMFMTGLFPFGTYAFPCFAGILLMAIAIEIGYPLAVSVYVVVSVLSVLFVADKEAATFFVLLFGYYPMIKKLIERIKVKVLQFIVKFIVFNAAVVSAFYIASFVFSISTESYTVFGLYIPWLFLIIGNVFFLFYDICIDKLIIVYMIKIHPIFNKKY